MYSKKLQTLINYLKGDWISQQTIYDFIEKKITSYEYKMKIFSSQQLNEINLSVNSYICQYKSSKKIIYDYVPLNNKYPIIGKLKKKINDKVNQYIFKLNDINNLKILHSNNKIIYIEYIYLINSNFKISVIVIKKSNQYNAISFTSDIKII
uniref:Chromophore lyase n=1 Tax=Dicranema revolutum TaxID=239144 RepID=A0A4D6WU55_9FLOR|nr:hypothetical protein [Dicranema revolutum]